MKIPTRKYSEDLPKLSASKAWEIFTDINNIGLRWMGSKGEMVCKQYIHDKMKEIGLSEVHQEEFPYLHYTPISSNLEVLSPTKIHLPSEPLEYTLSGTAEGKLIYVGSGSKEEFEQLDSIGIDFTESIVASHSSSPFWVCPLAEERGAKGLIIITDAPEDLIRHLTARIVARSHLLPERFKGYPAKIPGVITNANSGFRLLSIASTREVNVKITQKCKYENKMSANVIGIIPGFSMPNQKAVIGAHFDTQLAGGAWDNGTGVAGMLEIARAFIGLKLPRSIEFVAFAGEETGEWGSFNYVKRHEDEIKNGNYICMSNLDAVSSSLTSVNAIWSSPAVQELAFKCANELDWSVESLVDLSSDNREFSDQCAFHEAGVPSVWIWEYPCMHPYYHTKKDLPIYIDPYKWIRTLTVTALFTFKSLYKPVDTEKIGFKP